MKYDKYIISFAPGSSGRFVRNVLNAMILQITDPMELTDLNSAHNLNPYTGISVIDPNVNDIYEILEYHDRPDITHTKIISTHVYPDFNTINNKFKDIGIIIIRYKVPEDIGEVVQNSWYKNKTVLMNGPILEHRINERFKTDLKFMDSDNYPQNCLVIDYQELYQTIGETFVFLEKLKEFTGITNVTDSTIAYIYQYIKGRDKLLTLFGLR